VIIILLLNVAVFLLPINELVSVAFLTGHHKENIFPRNSSVFCSEDCSDFLGCSHPPSGGETLLRVVNVGLSYFLMMSFLEPIRPDRASASGVFT
jgi:hypothetical protein